MPTFPDPQQDAAELGEAARGLAHATRHIEHPADTYQVLGSLHYALTSVQQSLSQLASWHHQHSGYAATDDGNQQAGQEHAEKAGGWARIAAASLDQVVDLVMRAQGENGRIAWQPDPSRAALPSERSPLAEVLRDREAELAAEQRSPGERPDPGGGVTR
ncbi:hypothetical protein [Leucobacter chromiiresistens]|uniref:Uncharacterized protein n=1 Tax=Leucobacter chromiiresistens TaxID=1079994 RepID=A0A1H0Z2T1_9MICO|nr:hypothetical protein [Leucobacter chromiiresistens]SDQ21694.1 hypothetical protein SAMN04488565_1396 [Leucobacter chromiiresistens]